MSLLKWAPLLLTSAPLFEHEGSKDFREVMETNHGSDFTHSLIDTQGLKNLRLAVNV